MGQQSASASSQFERCPLEIAAHIASMEMRHLDILNLRRTSRRMCSLFTPSTFHEYTHRIKLSVYGIGNSKEHVSNQPTYSPIPAAFAPHITRLWVTAQAIPDFDAMELANTVPGADRNRKFGKLWEEISQLTSIKGLGWAGQSGEDVDDDTENAQLLSLLDKTISAVQAATGKHLQTIHIFGKAHYGLPNSLLHLEGLSKLALTSPWKVGPEHEERRRAFVSQIRSIITRNKSTLQSTNLELATDIPLTLEDVFPPEAVELRLARVHLSHIQTSQAPPKALASVPQLRVFRTYSEEPSDNPSGEDHIWDALRVNGITVQRTINYPTISHMKYLGSFSGLTTFSTTISSPVDPAVVDFFFNAVLPAQAASLDTITFRYDSRNPVYDGFVYSSRDQWFGRLSFPRLRHLHVYAPSDWDFNQSRCQSLLDEIQGFPVLDIFSVQWPKYTKIPEELQCDQLPFGTKTGRPSIFTIRIRGRHNLNSLRIAVGKSDS